MEIELTNFGFAMPSHRIIIAVVCLRMQVGFAILPSAKKFVT